MTIQLTRLAPLLALATAVLAGCGEPVETFNTQAQCDTRCDFFIGVNTELACDRAVTDEDCDIQCLEEDPCQAENLAWNTCRYQQPAEDYQCDTAGLGYPILTGEACSDLYSVALDCAFDNFDG